MCFVYICYMYFINLSIDWKVVAFVCVRFLFVSVVCPDYFFVFCLHICRFSFSIYYMCLSYLSMCITCLLYLVEMSTVVSWKMRKSNSFFIWRRNICPSSSVLSLRLPQCYIHSKSYFTLTWWWSIGEFKFLQRDILSDFFIIIKPQAKCQRRAK